MDYTQVIHSPVITEKVELVKKSLSSHERYVFRVHRMANKEIIRQALRYLYKVKVLKINIMNVPSKMKSFRRQASRHPGWKKAIVTLAPGQTLDLLGLAKK